MIDSHQPQTPLILLVFANDPKEPLDEIQQEMESLQSTLQPVADRLDYDIQILEYSTIDDFIATLDDNRERLILLHFAGHSNSEVLRLDEGVAHASGLSDKLKACEHLQLLFLNGCNNADQVKSFVEVGVAATIGTYFPIVDRIAREFSEAFYCELAERRQSIENAFAQAKATINTKHGEVHQQLRSFDLGNNSDPPPPTWAWFLLPEEQTWKLEEAAHPCNRLPVLPDKTLEELPEQPFKNLYYYTPDDADIFFGRCQASLDVLNQLDNSDTPLLLLHGGTGVGKSSFLMAGLLPRLYAREQTVTPPFRYNEQITSNNLLSNVFQSDTVESLRQQMDSHDKYPSIWIVDQLEEIFFKPEKNALTENEAETDDESSGNPASQAIISKDEKQDNLPDTLNYLLKTLKALFPPKQKDQWPNARIILSLRTEWFGELHDACRSYQLTTQDYMLRPLGKNDIIEIIEQPARKPLLIEQYGLQIENPEHGRLAEQIADDLLVDKESNIAPPLQIMLSKLWQDVEGLPKSQRIWTQTLYQERKKQGLLLSEHLDRQLEEISTLKNEEYGEWGKQANQDGLLLDVLQAHTTAQGTTKTLPISEYNQRYAHIAYRKLLARTFTDRYLLIDAQNNKQQLRLAHDTLAQVVKAKYEASELPGQRARRILDSRKVDWKLDDDNQPKGIALDKNDLKLVEKGQQGTSDWQQDRIENAIVVRSRKRRRNGRFVVASVFLGFIVAFIVTAFLYNQSEIQKELTEKQLLEANYNLAKTFEQKALKSLEQGDKDKNINNYQKAWLYALNAQSRAMPENKKALQPILANQLLESSLNKLNPLIRQTPSFNLGTDINSVALSADGSLLASSGLGDNTIKVWDVVSGKLKHTLEGHQESVTSVALSADGALLASGSYDKTIKLWDVVSGELKHTLEGHKDGRTTVALSADGALLASSSGKAIKLWDVISGKLKYTLEGHQERVSSVALSADGALLASGSDDRVIKLWDVTSGELKHSLEGHQGWVSSVALSADGALLASGSDDRTIKLWNVVSGELKHTLKGHQGEVISVALSVDGTLLASVSDDRVIKLWDVVSGELKHTLKGHHNDVRSVALSADGALLASGSHDKTIKLWDVVSGELKYTLKGHQGWVSSVVLSADGVLLASSSDKAIKLWDAVSGELKYTLEGHKESVSSVALSADGALLASSSGKAIKLWDVVSGELKHSVEGYQERVSSVALSADGALLALGSDDQTIKLWDVISGELKHSLEGHQDGVTSVTLSADGVLLASSGLGDNTIKVWDVVSGKLKHTLEGHQESVTSVALSADGALLASGSYDKTIKLWDVVSGELKHTLEGHKDGRATVALSADGALLASSSGKTIKLWDVVSGELKHSVEGHQERVSSVALSADGALLASGSHDQTIKLWDVASGKLKHTLKGHQDDVYSVALSADRTLLASGSADRAIKLWDVDSGELKHSLEGHQERVSSVALSADGALLASGSYDKTIKLWDVISGKLKYTLEGHQGRVSSVALSADGTLLVSGSYDKTIKLWDVASGKLKHGLERYQGLVHSVALSADGALLALSSGNTIKLWDVVSGELKHSLEGHQDEVYSVALNADGALLASGSHDQTIKLWDVVSGDLKHTLEGHQDRVRSVALSADGSLLASGSHDQTIKLWDVVSGELKHTLEGHKDWVSSMALSIDGTLLASGSHDHTIKIWDINVVDLLKKYNTTQTYSALSFLWQLDLDKDTLEITHKPRAPSLLPNEQGYYYSRDLDKYMPLLEMPKKGETKADQIIQWLQNQCAYQDKDEVKKCCADKNAKELEMCSSNHLNKGNWFGSLLSGSGL